MGFGFIPESAANQKVLRARPAGSDCFYEILRAYSQLSFAPLYIFHGKALNSRLMKEFFLSYNKANRDWAEWIAWTLEEAGYATIIQAWDFRAGENSVLKMQTAMTETVQTVAVLSKDYLAALFTQSEWTAAFASDPTGEKRKLIPVRVQPCELPPPFQTIIYCDLVGLDPLAAKEALLSAAREDKRLKPSSSPPFPGSTSTTLGVNISTVSTTNLPPEVLAVNDLLNTLETTYTTFLAQADIRDELFKMMRKRLGIFDNPQYEDFFRLYYPQMNPEERHLHDTMRGYTVHVLNEYNGHALKLLEQYPALKQQIARLGDLERHLIVWKGKYEGVFLPSPFMSLCYVGVRENVPFPSGIEDELRSYLNSHLSKTP